MTRISRSRMDMEGGRVDNALLKNYGKTLVGGASGTNTGSSYTIDLSGGNVFNLILNANCTFVISNAASVGIHGSFTLMLQQDATGGRIATWPGSVVWPSGSAPTLTSTKNSMDLLRFATYDGGTTWFGFVMAQNYPLTNENWIPYGYFGGGYNNFPSAAYFSTVDRIDYSNDTATAAAKGPLSLARSRLGATGNSSFGYFGGGRTAAATGLTTVDRIDYSSDTSTAAAKGPLSFGRRGVQATGSSAFGYFGGGYTPTPATYYSLVDRIDYSNDTATAVAKGPLAASIAYPGATGTSSFGYFAGGGTPIISTVSRIDYSNDTATAVAKGPISSTREFVAGVGHTLYGYFGGGGNPAFSTIDRIDYSNDTATAAVKGPLSLSRLALGASGNYLYGYFGGGGTPTLVTTVDRIDYSNDTTAAAVKGPLSLTRTYIAATNHASGN